MASNKIDYGKPPKGGWAPIVFELYVSDINKSLQFWCEILDFQVAYQRPEEPFAYLERSAGAQVMLYQPDKEVQTGVVKDSEPKGMLQIFVSDLSPILESVTAHKWPLLREPEEVWRRWGDRMGGKREIRLCDPDGHLILVGEDIGERPL